MRAALTLAAVALAVLPLLLPSTLAATPVDRAQEVATTWAHEPCLPDESASETSHGLQALIRRTSTDWVHFAYINGSGSEFSWVDHIEVNGLAVTSDPIYDYTAPPPAVPVAWDLNPNYIEPTGQTMAQRVTLHVKYFTLADSTVHDATLELCQDTAWHEYILYGHTDPQAGASAPSAAFSGVGGALLRPVATSPSLR
jgi:hypothetical protein